MPASPCPRAGCWRPSGDMTLTQAPMSSTYACGACAASSASALSRRCAVRATSSPATEPGTGEYARLLASQRRFMQDASHQLRTPITIALGHAELLARAPVGRQEGHDIQVVL